MNCMPGFTLYSCRPVSHLSGHQHVLNVSTTVSQQVPGSQHGSGSQQAENVAKAGGDPQGPSVAKEMARQDAAEALGQCQVWEDRQRELQAFDVRMERNNVVKLMAQANTEALMLGNLIRAKEAESLANPRHAQEENLAAELSRVKAADMLREKQSQLLRESSVELKSLEAKLRGAYIARELDAQLREKEAAKIREKNREKLNYKILRDNWDQLEDFDNRRECQEMHQQINLRRDLQEQMIAGEEAKQARYQESLRDRAVIDQIVQKVHREDRQAYDERMEAMSRNRRELDLFKEAQAVWKSKERGVIEDENNRVQEYLNKQDTDEQVRKEERGERERERERLTDIIARKVYEQEAKKQRSEELRQDFMELKLREDQTRKDVEDHEADQRKRVDLRETHHRQMLERVTRLKQEADRDKEHRARLVQDMAENAKQGEMSNRKLLEKKEAFRRETERKMQERRVQRAEETQKVCMEDKLLVEQDQSRIRQIEEERMNMLREHSVNLTGYFPRGVLHKEDLPLLGEEFAKQYAAK